METYASAFWDDVRIGRCCHSVSPGRRREQHIAHSAARRDPLEPLQLWSNPVSVGLRRSWGVGSEVYEAVPSRAIGRQRHRTEAVVLPAGAIRT